MDVWHITVAALRRWYVLIPLLALTVVGALFVGSGVHPQYEVTATTTLVPGTVDSEGERLYGNVAETNQVLSIVVGATPAREAIKEQGLNSEYEIVSRDRSSVMNVSVLSDSRQESIATGEAVIELTRQELSRRQDAADIPSSAQISVQVLQPPSVSDVVSQGKTRNMAIVGILGAALSLLVAVLLDDLVGLVRRRLEHETRKLAHTEDFTERSPEHEPDRADGETSQDHEPPDEPDEDMLRSTTSLAPGQASLEGSVRHP